MARRVQEDKASDRWCVLGSPGSGKTSILKHVQQALTEQDWLCGYSEASPNAVTAVDEFLDDVRAALPTGRGSRKFSSKITEINISFAGIGTGIKLSENEKRPTHARVRELFTLLGEIAKKRRSGVAFFIDEAQALPDADLDLLVRSVSRLNGYPFALILAGLPGIPEKLERGESTQAFTWFTYLSPLTIGESLEALGVPIVNGGGAIRHAELMRMAKFVSGHPLTLQMIGSKAWDAALGSARHDLIAERRLVIEQHHVNRAIDLTREQLRVAYYEPMWRRCNRDEHIVLARLASGPTPIDLHRFVGITYRAVPAVDSIVWRLRNRGIILNYDVKGPDRGIIDFSIPGFGDYVLRAGRWI